MSHVIPREPDTLYIKIDHLWNGNPCGDESMHAEAWVMEKQNGLEVRVHAPLRDDRHVPDAPRDTRWTACGNSTRLSCFSWERMGHTRKLSSGLEAITLYCRLTACVIARMTGSDGSLSIGTPVRPPGRGRASYSCLGTYFRRRSCEPMRSFSLEANIWPGARFPAQSRIFTNRTFFRASRFRDNKNGSDFIGCRFFVFRLSRMGRAPAKASHLSSERLPNLFRRQRE